MSGSVCTVLPLSGLVALYGLSGVLAVLLILGGHWWWANAAFASTLTCLMGMSLRSWLSQRGIWARAGLATLGLGLMGWVAEMSHYDSPGPDPLLMSAVWLTLIGVDLLRLQRRIAVSERRTGWLSRGGLFRSGTSGAIATLADFAFVAAWVQWGGARPAVATLFGCAIGGFINFSINRHWAFVGRGGAYLGQAWRYAAISGSSALFNAALVGASLNSLAAVETLGVPYPIVWWLVRGLVFVGFNHPLNRDYVFRGAVA